MFTLGAQARLSLGTNVNTPFCSRTHPRIRAEYKVETLHSGTTVGVYILGTQCLNTAPSMPRHYCSGNKYEHGLRPVYTCDFSCDFGAILRTKPAPAYPVRVFSRVSLRRNAAKLAGIGKKGVFKKYVITFFPSHAMLREKDIRAG